MNDQDRTNDRERKKQELAEILDREPGIGPALAAKAAEAVLKSNAMHHKDAKTEAEEADKTRRVHLLVAKIAAFATVVAALITGCFLMVTNWSKPKLTPGTDPETTIVFAQKALDATMQLAKWKEQAEIHTKAMADKGDAGAKLALDEARRSGNTEMLRALLIHEADRLMAQNTSDEYLERCREIAGVAFSLGDINEAHFRAQTVLHVRPNDLPARNILGWIHHLRGELDDARRCYERILESTPDESWQAIANFGLAMILQDRGELERAEVMHGGALKVFEKLRMNEDIVYSYIALGLIYKDRNELKEAEALLRTARSIADSLGLQSGMGDAYGDLGEVYAARGEIVQADEMYERSLSISELLGDKQGVASTYCNMGSMYLAIGDLNRDEDFFRKALGINERLGYQQHMAHQYAKLGVVAQ